LSAVLQATVAVSKNALLSRLQTVKGYNHPTVGDWRTMRNRRNVTKYYFTPARHCAYNASDSYVTVTA